ncbi:MAG: 30S ribosomal protein S5 [Euryarchaeota archaeon]|nr:30S ribosomal protein S5 [Euryarchaeota archaeon]|tara:strand:- start:3211 stop:3996 length:786 start_codon:yes stop_codon:yes gene_type:complete
MSEEDIEQTEEEIPTLATGLAIAFGYADAPEPESGARRRGGPDRFADLRQWTPKTRLGRMILDGEIMTYQQALATGLPIREVEIIDALIPNLEEDVLAVNMIQRMTDSGRRVRFNVLCVVGNHDGYVGLAICKGKEVASTIQKAITKAKLDLIPVMRGNGSWESGQGPGKSVPIKVTGRSGSTRVTLMPAPAGKGLVIGDTGRRVLNKAGVTDVWSSTAGQTRTTINFAQATFNALKQLNRTRIGDQDKHRLHITHGEVGA